MPPGFGMTDNPYQPPTTESRRPAIVPDPFPARSMYVYWATVLVFLGLLLAGGMQLSASLLILCVLIPLPYPFALVATCATIPTSGAAFIDRFNAGLRVANYLLSLLVAGGGILLWN